MRTILIALLTVLSMNSIALEGSFIKKGSKLGVGLKAHSLEIQMLNGSNSYQEKNLLYSPDFNIYSLGKFDLLVNPSLGISQRTVTINKKRDVCLDNPNNTVSNNCYEQKDLSSTKIMQGLGAKINYQLNRDQGINIGVTNSYFGGKQEQHFAIGFTVSF